MANGNAVVKKNEPGKLPVGQNINDARKLFLSFQSQIESILPKSIKPELLVATALNSIRKTPKLLECDQLSMLSGLMRCAEVGALPDTAAQECHLVPFYNSRKGHSEVVWIAGYRLLIRLAMESGVVSWVDAHVVRDGDEFEYQYGSNMFLKHKECADPGDPTFYYAVAYHTQPGVPPLFFVMTATQMQTFRNSLKNRDSEPWVKNFDQMALKTVVRYLIDKRIPKVSTKLARAIESDYEAEIGEQPAHEALEGMLNQEVKSRTDKLAEVMGAEPTVEPEVEPTTDLAAEIESLEKKVLKTDQAIAAARSEHFWMDIRHPEITEQDYITYREHLLSLRPAEEAK